MKISTKGRYGLRLVLDLAVNYENGLTSLKDIAQRQEISEKYLEQIIILLHKSGLIKSMRGAQGGYTLTRHPRDITVGEVLRSLEGPFVPVDCVQDRGTCLRSSKCATITVWEKIGNAVNEVLDSMTMQDLVTDYNQKNGSDFCI
ncbi:RrF2 family transcriptional regulator [Acetanaerobacterium elongatum]|uniref:Transcriptional regulator, BadM/Rrf2 family n=1 Tax=Acetanaerobacterium elongatum TaxID=258515 RepID=A0A1H0CTI3_9FIRM|nr:Rrf2 family transcriptional regulator [Acetanaerobacterium elongatum]SDN61179.1 transcriptional regulator, BadM/Rrf2 family [Acetanaerobacterium elongatum]